MTHFVMSEIKVLVLMLLHASGSLLALAVELDHFVLSENTVNRNV